MKDEYTLINKIFENRQFKLRAIDNKNYQDAAKYRDNERRIQNELLDLLSVNYRGGNIENIFVEYLNKKFNIDYKDRNVDYKQFIRVYKLKELGIG
jgi:hypothetical protein